MPARPVFRRGERPPVPLRYNFATEALLRLALLAGNCCPNCGETLVFDGNRTLCSNPLNCTYSWDNPNTAESEIGFGLT